MNTTNVLNISICNITHDKLLDELDNGGVLFTPNVDHMVKLQYDHSFYDCYSKAEWVVCDSRILWMCSKLLRNPLQEAIPGSSFFTDYYLHNANNNNCRIFLLGARPGVAARAKQRINMRVGRSIVVGEYSPPIGFENDRTENNHIADIINRSRATTVLVGLGAPKQEKWIIANKKQMPNVKVWMALGATIDFEAGEIQRAPMWVRKICLEWFYRFLMEPKRMFRRYFIDGPSFFYHFACQLIGIYKNPYAKAD